MMKTYKHLIIPDTQCKPGVNLDHLEACGNYIVDKKPDVIVHLGDHWDMPSLSTYEKPGSKYFHDKSYDADVAAGHEGFRRLMEPIKIELRKARKRKVPWKPLMIYLRGNHEYRIVRAINENPVLDGAISLRHVLPPSPWIIHPFLEIIKVHGILYSHYFVNQQSAMKGVLSGTIDNRLNKIKQSFTQGHQQHRMYGSQFLSTGEEIHGLVVGAFYSHDEEYMGPQGNHYWRGIVVKNEVHNGEYDPMFVSLPYLLKRWL
jgi:hypothetical protein